MLTIIVIFMFYIVYILVNNIERVALRISTPYCKSYSVVFVEQDLIHEFTNFV